MLKKKQVYLNVKVFLKQEEININDTVCTAEDGNVINHVVITATRTFDRLQQGKVKYLLSQLCLDVEYWSSSAPELNPQHPVLLTSTLSIRLIVSRRCI